VLLANVLELNAKSLFTLLLLLFNIERMTSRSHRWFVLVALVLKLVSVCNAKRNQAVYCGACIAMVDEMNWDIDHVDKKSTIQVGSFRVDPKGNQGLREIPLARSEVHLTELLEEVCNRMSNYGESDDEITGNKNYIRTSSRDGAGIALTNFRVSSETSSQLKFACETLVEEYEEDVLSAFKTSKDYITNHLCVDTMDVCKPNNVTEFKKAFDAALSATIRAESEKQAAAAAAIESADSDSESDSDSDNDDSKSGDDDERLSSEVSDTRDKEDL